MGGGGGGMGGGGGGMGGGGGSGGKSGGPALPKDFIPPDFTPDKPKKKPGQKSVSSKSGLGVLNKGGPDASKRGPGKAKGGIGGSPKTKPTSKPKLPTFGGSKKSTTSGETTPTKFLPVERDEAKCSKQAKCGKGLVWCEPLKSCAIFCIDKKKQDYSFVSPKLPWPVTFPNECSKNKIWCLKSSKCEYPWKCTGLNKPTREVRCPKDKPLCSTTGACGDCNKRQVDMDNVIKMNYIHCSKHEKFCPNLGVCKTSCDGKEESETQEVVLEPCRDWEIFNPFRGCVPRKSRGSSQKMHIPACKDDEIFNPYKGCVSKHRSRRSKTMASSLQPCRDDEIFMPLSGKCVSKERRQKRGTMLDIKPCADNEIFSAKVSRCVLKDPKARYQRSLKRTVRTMVAGNQRMCQQKNLYYCPEVKACVASAASCNLFHKKNDDMLRISCKRDGAVSRPYKAD